MRKLLTGCYAVLLVLMAAWPAAASQGAPPRYVSSEPSDGEELHQAPQRVEVTFDQPLDESSTLKILDECQRPIDGGRTKVDGNMMSIEVAETPSGMYHVEYLARGLGGITGERDGMFMFTVHAGEACGKGGDGNHHGNGKGTGNGHNGHGGDGGTNKHQGRHEGGGDNNGSGTHTNENHSSGSADHTSTHAGGAETHRQGGDHSTTKHGNPGTHHSDATDEDIADQASGGNVSGITDGGSDTARRLLSRADSGTLLLSLALCLGLGVAGGAILRASGAK